MPGLSIFVHNFSDMSAGNHEVRFNAIDLSSGVYFFRLESGNYSSAIKMVVGK